MGTATELRTKLSPVERPAPETGKAGPVSGRQGGAPVPGRRSFGEIRARANFAGAPQSFLPEFAGSSPGDTAPPFLLLGTSVPAPECPAPECRPGAAACGTFELSQLHAPVCAALPLDGSVAFATAVILPARIDVPSGEPTGSLLGRAPDRAVPAVPIGRPVAARAAIVLSATVPLPRRQPGRSLPGRASTFAGPAAALGGSIALGGSVASATTVELSAGTDLPQHSAVAVPAGTPCGTSFSGQEPFGARPAARPKTEEGQVVRP